MKSIMISIQPQWVEKILNGEKTIEIRKTMPKCELPCKVYIYCTKARLPKQDVDCVRADHLTKPHPLTKKYILGANYDECLNGKVVAEFTLNEVEKINCCAVPYRKTNNLGYEYFNDDGVYQLKDDDGLVFERDDNYMDSMLKNKDFEKIQLKPIDIYNYLGDYGKFYTWHINNLKIYDKPKELSEFRSTIFDMGICVKSKHNNKSFCKNCCKYYNHDFDDCDLGFHRFNELKRPPQSWCYVEEV